MINRYYKNFIKKDLKYIYKINFKKDQKKSHYLNKIKIIYGKQYIIIINHLNKHFNILKYLKLMK